MLIRALTIRQPFAELILRGEKRAECRTWLTDYRGLLAVHAAQLLDRDALRRYPHLDPDGLALGAIVGIVRLTDVRRRRDQFRWLLADPIRLPEPLPCRGRLSLWTASLNLPNLP